MMAIEKGIRTAGIYEGEDGAQVYVNGPAARCGYALDMGESIPIEVVTDRFIRPAEDTDKPLNRAGL